MLTAASFFDLSNFAHGDLFPAGAQAWEPLTLLGPYLESSTYPPLDRDLVPADAPLPRTVIFHDGSFIDARGLTIKFGDTTKGRLEIFDDRTLLAGASVIMAGAVLMGSRIKLGAGVLVEPGALIKSPVILGDCTEVRQGAYLRGSCLTGTGCVLGHTTEVKNTILLDRAKAGHFAYLGDSILGNDVNLGAGTKLANLRFTEGTIPIKTPDGPVDTGLRKLGAILGDQVQTGCNAVTSPGTLLGRRSMVLPNTTVRAGCHEDNSLIR